MKRLVLLGMLLILAAVPAVASAAPNKGDPISIRLTNGEFCGPGPCTPARMILDGNIKQTHRLNGNMRIELSGLSGDLRIGISPFANTKRHVNIKSPGPVRRSDYGIDALYETCLDSPTLEEFQVAGGEPYRWYNGGGWQVDTVVGLSAGSSKGSGQLGWWEAEFCQWREVDGGVFEKFSGHDSGSWLNGQLVGSKLSGNLNVNGPFPVY